MSLRNQSLFTETLLSVVASLLFLATPCVALSNAVTVTDLTGTSQPERPFSVSRIFAQGEIPNYAQPRIANTPLTAWQCDKMNSWPDGSLKHAIISFRYTVPAGNSISVDFVNNTNPSSAGDLASTQAAALSQAAMLAFDPGTGAGTWGAEIDATQGVTQTANARTMLTAGAWRYWLRGPVVTQVIVEDRTPARAYDFGWQCTGNCTGTYTQTTWTKATNGSVYQSLHPIFVLTFYAGWHGVQSDYILEDPWTDRLQDQYYNLVLKAHSDQSISEYTYPNYWHNAATRWRRRYWEGMQPGRVKTDLNFPYLVQSHAVLNWDQTKVVGGAAVALETADFESHMNSSSAFTTTLPEDLLPLASTGQYTGDMGTTGGRAELGPLPRADVRWLYTQDDGLYRVLIGNANSTGGMPVHVREARTDNYLLSSALEPTATTKAFGYFTSKDARPTGNYYNLTSGNTADQIAPVGTTRCSNATHSSDNVCNLPIPPDNSTGLWYPDLSHWGATPYVAYLATGDWYLLEELEAAAQFELYFQPDAGSTALLSNVNADLRGAAWPLRNIALAAFSAPDADKAGIYINEKTLNNIAAREGQYNITAGILHESAAWQYGYTNYRVLNQSTYYLGGAPVGTSTANPWYIPYYHIYDHTNGGTEPNGCVSVACFNANTVGWPHVPWQVGYYIVSMGWLSNLGFTDATTLLAAQSKYIINMEQAPGTAGYHYNPYLLPFYVAPALDTNDNWLSGQAMWDAWSPEFHNIASWTADPNVSNQVYPGDAEHGYNWIIYAATALAEPYSDGNLSGQGSWKWIVSANSAWAAEMGSNASTATCSGYSSGSAVANCDNPKWALAPIGGGSRSRCDLNSDGVVNILDVQLTIDQSLGLSSCSTGDINGDGSCNSSDVQIIKNAALAGSCLGGS